MVFAIAKKREDTRGSETRSASRPRHCSGTNSQKTAAGLKAGLLNVIEFIQYFSCC